MNDIYVLDNLNNREFYVMSTVTPFVENQYFVVDNKFLAEVVEVYNFKDIENLENKLNIKLKNIQADKIDVYYVAKLSLLEACNKAIDPNAKIRRLNKEEVNKCLLNKNDGLILGEINGTEDLKTELDKEYRNLLKVKREDEVVTQQGLPFILNHYMFKEYPHIGIFGGSGSGKTFGLRVICEELMKKRIPGIILDPHNEMDFYNNEYSNKDIKYKDRYEVFEVGKNCGIKFAEIKTTELISLLEFIGEMSQAMRVAIEALHEEGETLAYLISKVEKLKTAFEFELKYNKKKDEELPADCSMLYVKYKNKVAGVETLQALQWRLNALEKLKIFDMDISSIESCILRRKIAVIRSSSYFILKIFSAYLSNKLYRKRRSYVETKMEKFPPFFIIVDEAHNFAGKENHSPIKLLIKEISQEARKYGVFLILSTQRPALLDNTILAQLNTKLIFRTNIKSDMETIKTETNLNENEFLKLPKLETGNCFISSALLTKTFFIKIRYAETESKLKNNPFEELEMFDGNSEIKQILMNCLPIDIKKIPNIQSLILKEHQKYIDVKDLIKILDDMVEEKVIEKERSPFGERYIKYD